MCNPLVWVWFLLRLTIHLRHICPGNAKKGAGFKEDTVGKDPKKSGIPEDDAAKDEAKRLQEQQGMK